MQIRWRKRDANTCGAELLMGPGASMLNGPGTVVRLEQLCDWFGQEELTLRILPQALAVTNDRVQTCCAVSKGGSRHGIDAGVSS